MMKQVYGMVEKLQERDMMQNASDEWITLLLSLASRVQEIRETATLDDLEALSILYAKASEHLSEFSQYVQDCETVIKPKNNQHVDSEHSS